MALKQEKGIYYVTPATCMTHDLDFFNHKGHFNAISFYEKQEA